jgi:hypothetical protein
MLLLISLLLACGGKAPDTSGETADSAGISDTSGASVDTAALGGDLYGERPAAPVALPEFVATNRDGTPRGRADLLGGPTVVWFYPAAGTYG